jgi:hypothetical protein
MMSCSLLSSVRHSLYLNMLNRSSCYKGFKSMAIRPLRALTWLLWQRAFTLMGCGWAAGWRESAYPARITSTRRDYFVTLGWAQESLIPKQSLLSVRLHRPWENSEPFFVHLTWIYRMSLDIRLWFRSWVVSPSLSLILRSIESSFISWLRVCVKIKSLGPSPIWTHSKTPRLIMMSHNQW